MSPESRPLARVADRLGRELAKHSGVGGMFRGVLGSINRLPGALLGKAQAAAKPVLSRMPGLGAGSWKAKALVGGVGLGAGYGAYRGGKALYEGAMKPAPVKIQGGGPRLLGSVNEWGEAE